MFRNVRKAGKKILEEFENLADVGFVKFKGAVQSCPVVLVKMYIEAIKVWNAAIHMLNHFVLKFEKSRVIKWDPDVAREGGSRVVTQWTET
jgi:hypothetical protein